MDNKVARQLDKTVGLDTRIEQLDKIRGQDSWTSYVVTSYVDKIQWDKLRGQDTVTRQLEKKLGRDAGTRYVGKIREQDI